MAQQAPGALRLPGFGFGLTCARVMREQICKVYPVAGMPLIIPCCGCAHCVAMVQWLQSSQVTCESYTRTCELQQRRWQRTLFATDDDEGGGLYRQPTNMLVEGTWVLVVAVMRTLRSAFSACC